METSIKIKIIDDIINYCQKENPCDLEVQHNEPMSKHTTFKVGGPADCLITAKGESFPAFAAALLRRTREAGVPVFIIGGGANIVASDKGIRGIVLDTSAWKGRIAGEDGFAFRSGTTMDEAAECAAAAGFSGLEFLAGMPGTIGGAVWMNARCYGREIADVLAWTEIITNSNCAGCNCAEGAGSGFTIKRIAAEQSAEFGYKRSPFQNMDCLILSASFELIKGSKDKILTEMKKNRQDRQAKGHYDFPCAGSAFKNNRNFGKPTGQIIDELGLRGFSINGAQIAPFHGNIVINTGNATAADIRALMDEVAAKVKTATGFILEPEILFAGEWQ